MEPPTGSLGNDQDAAALHVQAPTRVVVVDDDDGIRSVLMDTISAQPDMTIVGNASGGHEGKDLCLRLVPDVVVLDVHMPDGDGWELARLLRAGLPEIRLVAYSSYDRALIMRTVHTAGVNAYVTKGSDPRQLLAAIRGADTVAAPSSPARGLLARVSQPTQEP